MKNQNMKWLSFALVLVMMLALLAPMTLAENIPEDTVPENAIGDIAAITDTVTEDATAEDTPAEDVDTEDNIAKDDIADDTKKMIFEPLNFVKNLNYMGLGMLGIFIVIGVIILATALLNKLFKDKKEN